MRVLGIAGSLRRESWNRKLLRAAAELLPPGAEFVEWDRLAELPPFNQDDEANRPEPVADLWNEIAAADLVIIATPEYNHSIPGVLKNALDWVSRPLAETPFKGKPVVVIGASTSMFGAVWAQAEVRKVLGALHAKPLDRELPVSSADQRFDAEGRLADEELRAQLADILAEATESLQATAA
jgi:chromate reductase